MRMTIRFALGLATAIAFLALVYAQHGGGHGGGPPGGAGGGMGSSRASDPSSMTRGNSGTPGMNSSRERTPSELLSQNTKLSSKLQGLLPAGTNLQTALQGFKNLGQFVAAVHVSHNLDIPFSQLKARMVGPPSESLGKAIQDLKPSANAKEETRKGEKQAKQDMDDSGGTS